MSTLKVNAITDASGGNTATINSGVVFAVHYTIDAVDGEHSAGAYGSIGSGGIGDVWDEEKLVKPLPPTPAEDQPTTSGTQEL